MVGGNFLKKIKIKQGDVFEFKLPNEQYAYGRSFTNTTFGFYKELSDIPNNPPVDSSDYFFIIWFQSEVLEDGLYPIVANAPFKSKEEAAEPPMGGKNPVYGYAIYENGMFREVTEEECVGLEPPTIFGIDSIIERIMLIIEKDS